MELFLIEKRLQEDKYNNNKDRQKDINEVVKLKQEYIDGMRIELYREEREKYRFLHKYTNYDMKNDIINKKKLLENEDWSFSYSEKEDIELMVETRDNIFMYGLFDRIGRVYRENGIGGLGNYDDIRERTIIDNLLLLNDGLNDLEEVLNER